MSGKEKVIIITDGTESILSIARSLADSMTEYKVSICPVEKFSGTDILPAQIFFIGCEKPSPQSFSYLEELFSHINFAGRKCGVFSTNKNAFKYLEKLVKDSEVTLGEPLLADADVKIKASAAKKWVKGVAK